MQGYEMGENEYFEVFENGKWKKVILEDSARYYEISTIWKDLENIYGFQNVRLTKDLTK